jgi:hypothetical protein
MLKNIILIVSNFRYCSFSMAHNGYVLAMVGHLKTVCPTLAQMPNRITNAEFTTVGPTIANTMLPAVFYHFSSNA